MSLSFQLVALQRDMASLALWVIEATVLAGIVVFGHCKSLLWLVVAFMLKDIRYHVANYLNNYFLLYTNGITSRVTRLKRKLFSAFNPLYVVVYYLCTHRYTHTNIQTFADRSNYKKPGVRLPQAGAPGLTILYTLLCGSYSNIFEIVSTEIFLDSWTKLISGIFLFKTAILYN